MINLDFGEIIILHGEEDSSLFFCNSSNNFSITNFFGNTVYTDPC